MKLSTLHRSARDLALAVTILGAAAVAALRAAVSSSPHTRAVLAEAAFAGVTCLNLRLRAELAEAHRRLADAATGQPSDAPMSPEHIGQLRAWERLLEARSEGTASWNHDRLTLGLIRELKRRAGGLVIAPIVLALLGADALAIAAHQTRAGDRARLRRTGAARVIGAYDRARLEVRQRGGTP